MPSVRERPSNRRPASSARIRERNGVWHADLYYLTPEGRRKRQTKSTGVKVAGRTSRQTAELIATELEHAIAREPANRRGKRTGPKTLKQAYTALIESKELAGRAQATLEIIAYKSVPVLRHFGADRDLHAEPITFAELEAYAIKARKKRHAGTVFIELLRLRGAIKQTGQTPPACPDLGRIYTPRERALTVEEFAAMVPYINPRWRENAIMYRTLGLSYSELMRITPHDVDLSRGAPDAQGRPGGTVRVRGTKRATRDRLMPLPPQARDILERRLRGAGGARGDEGLPFSPWGVANGNHALTRAARRAGVALDPGEKNTDGSWKRGPERISFNMLRASFATELVLRGEHNKKIANLMGHSTTDMVDRVYARLRVEDLESAMEGMASYEVDGQQIKRNKWDKGAEKSEA